MKSILSRMHGINDVINGFAIIFYMIVRLTIIGVIGIVFTEHDINSFWLLDFIFIFYVVYPVYIHFFNMIFYKEMSKR